jgi:hypothetical protein
VSHHEIPTRTIGRAIVVDDDGVAALTEAVEAWRSRPKVTRDRSKALASS